MVQVKSEKLFNYELSVNAVNRADAKKIKLIFILLPEL